MYVTYKITNTVTGEYYIGSHKTDDPNDDYMGSGKLIKESIKKYGVSAHTKEIIETFDNRADSVKLEHELIRKKKADKLCINMSTGGESFDYINNNLKFDRSYFGSLASHTYATTKKTEDMDNYYKNPKKCRLCGKILPYEKKSTNIFCSGSCAATYNNSVRNPDSPKEISCKRCGKKIKYDKRLKYNVCKQCYITMLKNKEIVTCKPQKKISAKRELILNNKDEIIKKHMDGLSYRKIGNAYGVSGNFIKELIKGRLE